MEGCKVLFQHEHGDCTRCVQRSAPHTAVCASSHTHVATDLLHSVCVCRRSTTSSRMTTTCALQLARACSPFLVPCCPSSSVAGSRTERPTCRWQVRVLDGDPALASSSAAPSTPAVGAADMCMQREATAPSSGGGVVGAGAADGVAGRMAGGAGRRAPAAEAEVSQSLEKTSASAVSPAHPAARTFCRMLCHPHALPPARSATRTLCCHTVA